MVQLKTEKTGKETADWEKSIREVKVRVGLQCHESRRRRATTFVVTEDDAAIRVEIRMTDEFI